MPWKECNAVSLREEFVAFVGREEANVSLLCERFGISRKTGYKWLRRFREEGRPGLVNRSRRPDRSPKRTSEELEQAVLAIRDLHPAWGGRKIRTRLEHMGRTIVPAASTITAILHRHERIGPEESLKHRAFVRFERPAPNDLWQMDFKGHVALRRGGRCHPLTVLDDHSRFAIGLQACGNERTETVQAELMGIFRRYGLPKAMLMDNGSPWGGCGYDAFPPLAVWLLRLRIRVCHGQPHHPQTQGKDERFHRTLTVEVLRGWQFDDIPECQRRFDPWRDVYNLERPHEALGMAVPASRYRVSLQTYPELLPEIEYSAGDSVRQVHHGGFIRFKGREHPVGQSFEKFPVAVRPTSTDGLWDVYFCQQRIKQVDERAGRPRVR